MDSTDAIAILTNILSGYQSTIVESRSDSAEHHWHNSRHHYYTGGQQTFTLEIQFHNLDGFYELVDDLKVMHTTMKEEALIREQNDSVREAYEAYKILLKLHGE